jgi:hypothetical protein
MTGPDEKRDSVQDISPRAELTSLIDLVSNEDAHTLLLSAISTPLPKSPNPESVPLPLSSPASETGSTPSLFEDIEDAVRALEKEERIKTKKKEHIKNKKKVKAKKASLEREAVELVVEGTLEKLFEELYANDQDWFNQIGALARKVSSVQRRHPGF